MPPKKQQNQSSSSSKVKVDKVSKIHPYRLSYMPIIYADLWLEECAFHLLATASSTPRTDTPLKKEKQIGQGAEASRTDTGAGFAGRQIARNAR